MEKRCVWRGYQHTAAGVARFQEISHSIELTEEKFNELYAAFKEWKGSQKDFYFKYVNPFKLRELPKFNPRAVIKTPIKTELKGGK